MDAFQELFKMFELECGLPAKKTYEFVHWLHRNANRPDVLRLLDLTKKYSKTELMLSLGRRSLLRPQMDGTVRLVWRMPANRR